MTLREIPRSKGPFGIVVGSYGVKCSVGPRGHHTNNVGQFDGPIPVSFEDSNFCKTDTKDDKMDCQDDASNNFKPDSNQSNHTVAKEPTKPIPTTTIEKKQQDQPPKLQNQQDSNANGNTNASVFASIPTVPPFQEQPWMMNSSADVALMMNLHNIKSETNSQKDHEEFMQAQAYAVAQLQAKAQMKNMQSVAQVQQGQANANIEFAARAEEAMKIATEENSTNGAAEVPDTSPDSVLSESNAVATNLLQEVAAMSEAAARAEDQAESESHHDKLSHLVLAAKKQAAALQLAVEHAQEVQRKHKRPGWNKRKNPSKPSDTNAVKESVTIAPAPDVTVAQFENASAVPPAVAAAPRAARQLGGNSAPPFISPSAAAAFFANNGVAAVTQGAQSAANNGNPAGQAPSPLSPPLPPSGTAHAQAAAAMAGLATLMQQAAQTPQNLQHCPQQQQNQNQQRLSALTSENNSNTNSKNHIQSASTGNTQDQQQQQQQLSQGTMGGLYQLVQAANVDPSLIKSKSKPKNKNAEKRMDFGRAVSNKKVTNFRYVANPDDASNRSVNPIVGDPTDIDVICGRGRGVMNHKGNKQFHKIIESFRNTYQKSSKSEKTKISNKVLSQIHDYGGRFLFRIPNSTDAKFQECDDAFAREKVSHALREPITKRQPKIKNKPKSVVNLQQQSYFKKGSKQGEDETGKGKFALHPVFLRKDVSTAQKMVIAQAIYHGAPLPEINADAEVAEKGAKSASPTASRTTETNYICGKQTEAVFQGYFPQKKKRKTGQNNISNSTSNSKAISTTGGSKQTNPPVTTIDPIAMPDPSQTNPPMTKMVATVTPNPFQDNEKQPVAPTPEKRQETDSQAKIDSKTSALLDNLLRT